MTLAFWSHTALLATVIVTDAWRRIVPRAWSGLALLLAGWRALLLPAGYLHLLAGGLLFWYAYNAWARGYWGGGDVFVLTYLGLLLGPTVCLAALGGLLAWSALTLSRRWLTFRRPLPLGALFAGSALVLWVWLWRAPPALPAPLLVGWLNGNV